MSAKKPATKKARPTKPRIRKKIVTAPPTVAPAEPLTPGAVKIVASCIAKGGSGKTTISVHLAHYLAMRGEKVLMVDCDPQANSTQVFIDDDFDGAGVSSLFHKKGGSLLPVESNTKNVLILPADSGLSHIDGLKHGEEYLFRENLREVAAKAGCRYVVIDTPPTLTMGLALAPLTAANFVLSPLKPDAYGLRGVGALLDRIEQIRVDHNPDLQYLGLLINLWNRRNSDLNDGVKTLEEQMGDFLIPHKIGDSSAIARVAHLRIPVWAHSTGAARAASKEMKAAMGWIYDRMESQA